MAAKFRSGKIISYLEKIERLKNTTICLRCEFSRNKLVHDKVAQHTSDVVTWIRPFQAEFKIHSTVGARNDDQQLTIWKPLERPWVCANFDVSYDSATKHSILGIVVRKEDGVVIKARVIRNFNIIDPFLAKAIACKQAMALAISLEFAASRLKETKKPSSKE
ncbi:hypothetical protein EPI10_005479 [Gossypium australe]|uniref:RNase H type-1 domain-containing protein n=1 Tax=Gossypium australe TaxID=47621 RepID=A0A5B6WQ10_9ROSI|nr:hypothetical protein EPI10_005479 [Gossypium australe]